MIAVLLCAPYAGAAGNPESTADVVATMVKGSAQVFTAKVAKPAALKKGDRLKQNQEIRVGEHSRVELRFPDGTAMRLAETTRLDLGQISFDQKTDASQPQDFDPKADADDWVKWNQERDNETRF